MIGKALRRAVRGAKIGAAIGGVGLVVGGGIEEFDPKNATDVAVLGASFGAALGAFLGGLGSLTLDQILQHCGCK